MKKFITAAVIATLAISSPASAAVSFDAATGTGFVGKGDVQLAFGWNNKQLQTNAAQVTFHYESQSEYNVTCEWTTEGRKETTTHTRSKKKKNSVFASITYASRTNKQQDITGFNLNGHGAVSETGDSVPNVGDACPGFGGTGAEVTAVDLISEEPGSLYVNYGGASIALPNTPVAVL
jgi:opacity protein-like surface antigen